MGPLWGEDGTMEDREKNFPDVQCIDNVHPIDSGLLNSLISNIPQSGFLFVADQGILPHDQKLSQARLAKPPAHCGRRP